MDEEKETPKNFHQLQIIAECDVRILELQRQIRELQGRIAKLESIKTAPVIVGERPFDD